MSSVPHTVVMWMLGTAAASTAPASGGPADRLAAYTAAVEAVAAAKPVLPLEHALAARRQEAIGRCRQLAQRLAAWIQGSGAPEDIEARLRSLELAAHRLQLLELRMRIVADHLARGLPEPRYGFIPASDLQRDPSNAIPRGPVQGHWDLFAARGERVALRAVLVPFDGGVSSPCYPATFGPFLIEPLQTEDGKAKIDPKAVTACLEDELKLDWQQPTGRLDQWYFLQGGFPDGLVTWWPYTYDGCRADLIQAYRFVFNVPRDQAPGLYKGRIRYWPLNYEQPTWIEVRLRVWGFTLPPPEQWRLAIRAGFRTSGAPEWWAAYHGKKPAEVQWKDLVWAHNQLCRDYRIEAMEGQTPAPDPAWLSVADPGPLSLTTPPVAVRLVAWQAWAAGKKGLLIPVLYDWTDQWKTAARYPKLRVGTVQIQDPTRMGNLVHPGFVPSLRLADLRDGLEDVEYLVQLEARAAKGDAPSKALLAEAQTLAAEGAKAASERLEAIRRRAGELLDTAAP